MKRALHIVGIGGGTGLPVLLRGLKQVGGLDITAIVCVADDGGSSGRLRESFGIPAVGDLRNCLVALSENGAALAHLFQHRFSGGNGLDGHSLGNLIMAALYQESGSLERAVSLAGSMLPLRGRALPVAEAPMTLCAELANGAVVHGESKITAAGGQIERIWVEPDDVRPCPGVLDAIASADAVVLGPGSLYTSILPNLLVAGVADAIRRAAGVRIFVCNLMTQPGETDGFSASDHLRVVQRYLGDGAIDFCLLNSAIRRYCLERYRTAGSEPVDGDWQRIAAMGVVPIRAALLQENHDRIRHDAGELGGLVVAAARAALETQEIYGGERKLAA